MFRAVCRQLDNKSSITIIISKDHVVADFTEIDSILRDYYAELMKEINVFTKPKQIRK